MKFFSIPLKGILKKQFNRMRLMGIGYAFSFSLWAGNSNMEDLTFGSYSCLKKGKGRYEKRITNQDTSMSDIEIHEHVVVDGKVGRLMSTHKA